jgi:murein DD-endopeptidase MepM/ murein hydrolase activator NlpD
MGHQGQDIRPSFCFERDPAAGRCEPYQEDVVAVSDGVLVRERGDLALYLVVDKPGEHIRFRYLHMSPQMLDASGMVTGRRVAAGEVLGSVGSYGTSERGTSYHLHLDAQVPTRAGWVFINPYMTLVGAYERLIDGRGQVVNDAMFAPPAPPTPTIAAAPHDAVAAVPATEPAKTASAPKLASTGAIVAPVTEGAAGKRAKVAGEDKHAEHCTTVVHRGHRRRVCGSGDAGARGRESGNVRSVDRNVPEQGRRPRHRGRYLHARHGGDPS